MVLVANHQFHHKNEFVNGEIGDEDDKEEEVLGVDA